jgi:hyperosmotically inducible protein
MFRIFAVLMVLATAGVCLAQNKLLTDNAINDQVRIRLSGDREVKGAALNVEVKEGVVTLTGTLETNRLKDKATKLAKKVKGVKKVVNNIEVKKMIR